MAPLPATSSDSSTAHAVLEWGLGVTSEALESRASLQTAMSRLLAGDRSAIATVVACMRDMRAANAQLKEANSALTQALAVAQRGTVDLLDEQEQLLAALRHAEGPEYAECQAGAHQEMTDAEGGKDGE